MKTYLILVGDQNGLRDGNAERKRPRKLELTELDKRLLSDIQEGLYVSSVKDKARSNALLKLRRRGLIENHGSRARPIWKMK